VSIQEGSGKRGCILSLGSLSPIVLVLFDDDAVVVSLYQVIASLEIADVIMKSWTLSIVSAAKFRMPNDTIWSFARGKNFKQPRQWTLATLDVRVWARETLELPEDHVPICNSLIECRMAESKRIQEMFANANLYAQHRSMDLWQISKISTLLQKFFLSLPIITFLQPSSLP
jgi:hypothetical protein